MIKDTKKTKALTLRVGVEALDRWRRAADLSLAWSVQRWIVETCNARARELLAQSEPLPRVKGGAR
jgi:uncharacterized protein (DUF1778 family)